MTRIMTEGTWPGIEGETGRQAASGAPRGVGKRPFGLSHTHTTAGVSTLPNRCCCASEYVSISKDGWMRSFAIVFDSNAGKNAKL